MRLVTRGRCAAQRAGRTPARRNLVSRASSSGCRYRFEKRCLATAARCRKVSWNTRCGGERQRQRHGLIRLDMWRAQRTPSAPWLSRGASKAPSARSTGHSCTRSPPATAADMARERGRATEARLSDSRSRSARACRWCVSSGTAQIEAVLSERRVKRWRSGDRQRQSRWCGDLGTWHGCAFQGVRVSTGANRRAAARYSSAPARATASAVTAAAAATAAPPPPSVRAAPLL